MFKGCDAVAHAVVPIDVKVSIKEPLLYFENNALRAYCTVARAYADTHFQTLVYISSAAVYGNPVKLPIDESHPTRPLFLRLE